MKFGKLTRFEQSGQTLLLEFEGKPCAVEAVTPKIIRVCERAAVERRSPAIEGDKRLPAKVTVEERSDGVWLRTEDVSVRVSDGFRVDFFDKDGKPVCEDYRGTRRPLERIGPEHRKLLESEGHSAVEGDDPTVERPVEVVKRLPADAAIYGLGDKTGTLNKRCYDYEMWNTDNPQPQVDTFKALYKSIPFLIVLGKGFVYGLFFDNTFRSWFNLGQESEDYFSFAAKGGALDYYYIAGDSMPEVVRGYTHLTGRCPLPQRWTLGYHQSRWGYVTQEDVADIADNLRSRDIPCDAIHLDIDYMEGFRVFTWNRERYHGDPEAFLAELSERGFKPVTIIDPGVKKDPGYRVYDEGLAGDFFAKTPDGEVYENAVWPGDAVFPDFGKPEVRKWWGEQHRFLLDKGVRGIWNDMNEPASFKGPLPDDVQFTLEDRPTAHEEFHNVYGHYMAKATYEGLKAIDGKRPFVITRAMYAGTQKYATAWTGDNTSMWDHLRMAIPQLCNLGLSGMPFVGTDLGGFGGDTTPELLVRWVQAGCLSPLFRNHSALGTRRQEPWQFGPQAEAIYRKYVKLRYRLIPYFYDLFREESLTGAPVMRPLVFQYERDPETWNLNDEFMVGDRLLAAPVVQQGAVRRMVYLPEGDWYDYWTRELLHGPQTLIREAPLDVCPLYVRAGSVLPVMEDQSWVGEKPSDTLLLDVFPGEGVWEHYQDNGEDFRYEAGEYNLYRITVRGDRVETELLHRGMEPYREIKTV